MPPWWCLFSMPAITLMLMILLFAFDFFWFWLSRRCQCWYWLILMLIFSFRHTLISIIFAIIIDAFHFDDFADCLRCHYLLPLSIRFRDYCRQMIRWWWYYICWLPAADAAADFLFIVLSIAPFNDDIDWCQLPLLIIAAFYFSWWYWYYFSFHAFAIDSDYAAAAVISLISMLR